MTPGVTMSPDVLTFQFGIGGFVLARNLAGVTHAESLQAPPQGGNTLNWMVGHVTRARNQALGLIGVTPLYDDAAFSSYGPRFDPAGALPLDEIVARFTALGSALSAALAGVGADRLAAPAPFSPSGNPQETIGTLLASIAFHEAYHLGQTGLSRRLLGHRGALPAPGEAGHD